MMLKTTTIPNIIHFIYVGGRAFSFLHFLAVYTAFKVHRPDTLYFHCSCEPDGAWWEKAKSYVTLHPIEAPTEIFGNPIKHYAHQADVLKLMLLKQYGGIYLDSDVISINAFQPLLSHQMVMGTEYRGGLCNATILARKDAPFLSIWFDTYKTFNSDRWNHHSVIVPWSLSKQYPHLITVLHEDAFFYPMYDDPTHLYLWRQPSVSQRLRMKADAVRSKSFKYLFHTLMGEEWQYKKLCQSYCVHLWESLWLRDYLSELTPKKIMEEKTNFSRLIKRIIAESELLSM